jgi:hypothetical protein
VIFRFAKSVQFAAALAGDHAAAIRNAPAPHTNAVFNLGMGISSSKHRQPGFQF